MCGFVKWYLATWNVRTLLDVDGGIETARHGSETGEEGVVDERKIDQVVGELDRCKVVVGSLQETKWFGSNVYRVGESVVLTSGREVPSGRGTGQRGECVTIVLSGPAVHAWKAGGSKWKAWSSRLVTVTLEVGGACAVLLRTYGCIHSLEWNTGLEHWMMVIDLSWRSFSELK